MQKEVKIYKFYIVKEYIEYYMFKNNLTKGEFCKICDIREDVIDKLNHKDYDFDIKYLLRISKQINVPMQNLVINLDKSNIKE